jgi:hypothetical protein
MVNQKTVTKPVSKSQYGAENSARAKRDYFLQNFSIAGRSTSKSKKINDSKNTQSSDVTILQNTELANLHSQTTRN